MSYVIICNSTPLFYRSDVIISPEQKQYKLSIIVSISVSAIIISVNSIV